MLSDQFIKKNVSVVIPTIGESTLELVVAALNRGRLVPSEIIIAIPIGKLESIKHLKGDNLKILALDVSGQVKQRIEGFKNAQHEYVLQLDSDIIVERDTLFNLVVALDQQIEKSAICPVYDNGYLDPLKQNRNRMYNLPRNLFNLLIDGRLNIPPGTITKAGVQTWPPFFLNNSYLSESEWLPGGCVLHLKKNLYLKDYYPFSGKAFSEDVIHSILLRKNGISLYICRNAVIKNEGAQEEMFVSFSKLLAYLNKTYKTKLLVMRLINGSRLRLMLWMFNYSISQIIRHLKIILK